jgi:hypothetical protein
VVTIASATANRVKPPPRAVTATMPATTQNAATIQNAAGTVWWPASCPLIVMYRMSASLRIGATV